MPYPSDYITTLPGIGKKRAELFAARGVRTVEELLSYFPRAYEDRTRIYPISQLPFSVPGCFEATVLSTPQKFVTQSGIQSAKVQVADETGRLTLFFFGMPYIVRQLLRGESYCFYGTLQQYGTLRAVSNPSFEPAAQAGKYTKCILPIYPLTAGLTEKTLRTAMDAALESALSRLQDPIPPSILQAHQLMDMRTAYRAIHHPDTWEQLEQAKRRIAFSEFFLFSCILFLLRRYQKNAHCAPFRNLDLSQFYQALPFSLTEAQQNAIAEIKRDLVSGTPMNRLLQGDVGSGKTMVAAAALILAAQNGYQAALMVPTELLAQQHFQSLAPLLQRLGIRTQLLTGSFTPAQKQQVRQTLADGTCQVVIGTHALFTRDVTYQNLGLVIADEQHRFGVSQRNALFEKGKQPHTLVMSATPIPRTLALLLYGDLDVSVLKQKPAGRQNIDTFLVPQSMHARIYAFVRKQVEAGHQVYVVCPAVEQTQAEGVLSAEQWAETLRSGALADKTVGLLHGQLRPAEKEAVMQRFFAGEIDVLVATTVIEVGVDVPNATLIVIENADRFGLSQLHQLRGRVGRGSSKSYCILCSSTQNKDTLRRLQALCKTNDGFQIAEEDLVLRGPGDFFGERQSGLPLERLSLRTEDLPLLRQAQQDAAAYLPKHKLAQWPPALRARISDFFTRTAQPLN